ncbi:SgcJ/EcaC family oxidoreductase [Nocardia wallacei]|uniref:SgcJ/EcaC family oxidoreductase n=1 Tax=Nocardia wallacei TaxID=480035 RepID=UPI002456CE30|nr:SgcJ/EcaC family oxidoreductase [Nocardia wallacei]
MSNSELGTAATEERNEAAASIRPAAYGPPVTEQQLRELEELVASIETGFNDKDAAVLDGRFTRDAVVIVPDGTTLRGWDELFAYHTARLRGPVADWTTRIHVVGAHALGPDTAVVHMRQRTTTPQGDFSNHGTAVVVRRDGAWWFAALQNTNVV